jgi:hypothetical protein
VSAHELLIGVLLLVVPSILLFRREQEKEIEKLRQEVEELHKQVDELRNTLDQILNIPNQTSTSDSQETMVKSALTSSCSSISMVKLNHNSKSQANLGQVIPQLDGILNSLPQACTSSYEAQNIHQHSSNISLQCETCNKNFETEEEFNVHDNAHQFCCDECYICFTTQVLADLHELETHPNTHYADTYIPQSTKLLFASGQPRNQPTNC